MALNKWTREPTPYRHVDRIAALEAALQELLDEQNGPPLIRDAARWEAAVKRAQDLLRNPEKT